CRDADKDHEDDQALHVSVPFWFEATYPIAVPPTVIALTSVVGMPTPTGTDWPSLPQVQRPSLSLKSLPTAVTFRRMSGPLPIRLTLRIGAVIRPPSIM